MTSNQIAYWVNEEKKRSNLAMERENLRHNLEQEKIGRQQAMASLLGAQASMYNASTNARNLAELQRHNLRTESTAQFGAETSRLGTVASALTGVYDSETKRGHLEIEREKLPYDKVESATKSIGNIVKSVTSIADILKLGGN